MKNIDYKTRKEYALRKGMIEIYNIDEKVSCYFDYEQYGEDIAEDEEYVELSDGRIANLSY